MENYRQLFKQGGFVYWVLIIFGKTKLYFKALPWFCGWSSTYTSLQITINKGKYYEHNFCYYLKMVIYLKEKTDSLEIILWMSGFKKTNNCTHNINKCDLTLYSEQLHL